MVIDRWPAWTLLVFETSQAKLFISGPPYANLVVVKPDRRTNGPIGLSVSHEQDHPRPFGRSGFNGVGPHPCLEFSTIATTEFEWRKSHPSMKSHHCY